ncbi:cardiolipin synthase [Rhodococcus sp. 27YEA15]|uniref:CDP-alcohol phosphatidyltransferase family protein n=1 Tax=Rhodococcus sp. 27YEA15 TaxID=3156259 RepID=UPI003C7A3A25
MSSGEHEPIPTDRILTVPNALSLVRLLALPFFAYLLLVTHADGWALALLMLSGFTDWLDGKLARVLGQTSRLGALLDPLVDRLYVVTTLVTFVARDFIPWWVAAILIGRDLLLALTLPIYRRRGLPPPEVIYLGKAATFLLMFALPLILAGHGDWAVGPATHAFGFAFLIWGTALYVWTALIYVLKAADIARSHEVVRR